MISILFVDDEVNILEGIRNSLRKRASEWRLDFAQSGQEALDILSKSKFDIIVSDMRMPGMDGAALLAKIQEIHPHMTRFILTGQADRESIVRAIPVTHQFIYKPCSPTDLLSLLDRTCALHDRIQNDDVRRLVSAAKSVPTAPKTAMKIAEILAGGQPSVREVAALIERDPGLSARILQVSNSAVMGRVREVTNITDAISCIGFESAHALAIANDVFQITPENRYLKGVIDLTYEKAFQGATLASRFLMGNAESGVAMTIALLRDLGLIVSAGAIPPLFKLILDPGTTSDELVDLEIRKLGMTHAEIGGHLLALWGIPMTIVEGVTCHHTIEDATIGAYIMASVHVSDIITDYPKLSRDELSKKINWEYVELHQLETDVNEWLDMGIKDLKNVA